MPRDGATIFGDLTGKLDLLILRSASKSRSSGDAIIS